MEAKFTKGEWRLDFYMAGDGNPYAYDIWVGENCIVNQKTLYYPNLEYKKELIANANLIAAAPKMYRKLESILKSLPIANETDEQEALRFEIMDLLADARGEL